MDFDNLKELGGLGIVLGSYLWLLRYITGTLTNAIKEQKQILVSLIEAINEIRKAIIIKE